MTRATNRAALNPILSPAALAVARFGSHRKLAEALSIESPSTTWKWCQRGDGVIPATWHVALLAAALERGIPFTTDEIVYGGRA